MSSVQTEGPAGPCAWPLPGLTPLCCFCNKMSISPSTVSLASYLRWIAGPGSEPPAHPLFSLPLGPIRALEQKINETQWQNSVYFKTFLHFRRSLSLWSEAELAAWYSLWSMNLYVIFLAFVANRCTKRNCWHFPLDARTFGPIKSRCLVQVSTQAHRIRFFSFTTLKF